MTIECTNPSTMKLYFDEIMYVLRTIFIKQRPRLILNGEKKKKNNLEFTLFYSHLL